MRVALGTVSLLLALLAAALAAEPSLRPAAPADERAEAARALLAGLGDLRREEALRAFDDAERRNWHFIPRENEGARLGDLDELPRRRLDELLAASLGAPGLAKVEAVRELERVLRERESQPDRPALHRDPDRYWVALFGEPGGDEPWGWRLQGHHLSLNFTTVGKRVAHTPLFFGANPRRVSGRDSSGRKSVELEPLRAEVEAARTLLASLDEEQRAQAWRTEGRPTDVVLGPGRDEGFATPEGLAGSAMTADQRQLLYEAVERWIRNLAPDLATRERMRLESAGLDDVHFLWVGERQAGRPQYFRLQGPYFVLEYATTDDDPNHVHAVWRDLQRDFGGDLLRDHLRADRGRR